MDTFTPVPPPPPPSPTHRHGPGRRRRRRSAGRRERRAAFRLSRSDADRLVAGVAGGLSERLGVDPVVVRLAFVVLAFAAGAGVVLYFLLWLVASEPAGTPPTAAGPFPPPPRGSHVGDRRALGLGLMVAGSLLLLREMGLWFGDKLVWPVALAALGSAVIWTRGDSARWARLDRATRRMRLASAAVSKLRILAGGILVAGGMAAFLAAHQALTAAKNVAFAVAVTATGVALVLGPWIYRLARQLSDERRERIRSEERGEMAAHLHDSVLQTLAMIQRSGSPQEMSSLARSQERELRSWLYGRARTGAEILTDASVSDAVDAMAAASNASSGWPWRRWWSATVRWTNDCVR